MAAEGLHPELRARLQKLGLGACPDLLGATPLSGDGSTEDEEGSQRQTGDSEKDDKLEEKEEEEQQPFARAGSAGVDLAQDSSIDDLLLQLDDLDARSSELQRQVKRDQTKIRQEGAYKPAPAATPRAALVRGTGQHSAKAKVHQHPLESGVGLEQGEGNFRRARQRREKPPLAPASFDSPARNSKLAASATDLRASSAAPTPSGARGRPPKRSGVGGSCSLPPLKPSASAPGCLISGPWRSSPSRGE
eukprot:TRINITY_DN89125_c0_g1_i1.p1 TRINITY_DN89125_c0_g1~~TRINITY_DN89125_c0_g1_i1.p1  ORF type:complete len:248 (+),score=51.95 TRINITY_DN89125_c0_g1_i1:56-799(+)